MIRAGSWRAFQVSRNSTDIWNVQSDGRVEEKVIRNGREGYHNSQRMTFKDVVVARELRC